MNLSDFKSTARKSLEGKLGKAVLTVVIYTLVILAFNTIENLFKNSVFGSLISIIELIITVPLSYGLNYAFLKLFNNEDISVGDFFTLGFNNFGRAWGISYRIILKTILPIILMIVCLIIFLGIYIYNLAQSSIISSTTMMTGFDPITILLMIAIVGLSIWATVKYYLYSLANYISMDYPEMTTKEAVEKSATLMNGNRGKLFALQLSFIGWAILCLFTCGIGLLWLSPYISFSTIAFYKYLDNASNSES